MFARLCSIVQAVDIYISLNYNATVYTPSSLHLLCGHGLSQYNVNHTLGCKFLKQPCGLAQFCFAYGGIDSNLCRYLPVSTMNTRE